VSPYSIALFGLKNKRFSMPEKPFPCPRLRKLFNRFKHQSDTKFIRRFFFQDGDSYLESGRAFEANKRFLLNALQNLTAARLNYC